MVENKANEELPDYNDFDIEPIDEANGQATSAKPTAYVGVNSTSFRDMLLKPEIQQSIVDCGFEHPSEVQQRCIPEAILGVDVLCQAVSGMGKTAVFVLTMLQNLEEDPKPFRGLILCHTRELAYQIKGEVARLCKFMKDIRCECIIGGEPKTNNIKMLKGPNPPHIVVGTPGRILDLIRDKHLPLDNLSMFVLDECDKLLDEVSMRSTIQKIFKETPRNKQVMMFTATLSGDIKDVCRKFMKNPSEVLIEQESKLTLHGLKQYYIHLSEKEKIARLMDLIDQLEFNQIIIFVKSVERAIKLAETLNKNALPSKAVHRFIAQDERIKIYEGFKEFRHRILVATEIFGRGIDIEKINIVFNYDMPVGEGASDSYLHRVGRAGRFGTKGLAITFVDTDEDKEVLEAVQKRFEVRIPELPTTINKASYMNN